MFTAGNVRIIGSKASRVQWALEKALEGKLRHSAGWKLPWGHTAS